MWQVITLVVLGCGVISCAIISPTQTWWNKYFSSDILPIAKIVNQANKPLLVVEKYWLPSLNLYSLSHFLEPKVQVLPLIEGNMVSTISDGFSNIYLLNPSEILLQKLKKSQKYQIQPIYNGHKNFQMMEIRKMKIMAMKDI
ncbi:MAG: hypothetical protein AAFV71_30630 [Cyanobacteria bacterium J06633_8]